MKKLLALFILIFSPAAFPFGSHDGIWLFQVNNDAAYAAIIENNGFINVILLDAKYLDWRAFAGKLEGDTSLISTVVDPYAFSSGKLTFDQGDTLTADVSYCLPRIGGYCKYPNGLKITGKKIW